MLHNKRYHELYLINSISTTFSAAKPDLHIFDYVRNPDEPTRLLSIQFCLQHARYRTRDVCINAMIAWLSHRSFSRGFLSERALQVLEHDIPPPPLFMGRRWESNHGPHSSIISRPPDDAIVGQSRLKLLPGAIHNKRYHEFKLINSISTTPYTRRDI